MRPFIARILRAQARRLLSRVNPQVIVVTGSVGKTSTTQAIATVLGQNMRVRSTLKNYNSDVGVPCSLFKHYLPESLKNPFAWILLILRNEIQIVKGAPFDVAVLELGTDTPGEISQFVWLQPDIAVVSAVAPEHMEFFKSIDAVAQEELSVMEFSNQTFINETAVDPVYLTGINRDTVKMYGRRDIARMGVSVDDLHVVGDHSLDALAAAAAVAAELGMDNAAVATGLELVQPQPGRMRTLDGIYGSTLIDDTYNASPSATTAALDYLYTVDAPQRIALLGNMNELGGISEHEHTQIGDYCDVSKLDLVVTLGPDANRFTAPAARAQSCTVVEVQSPYEAAHVIREHMKKGAYILFKGSQNGVFAEEAVKKLLNDIDDTRHLVRQNDFWMNIKRAQFVDMASRD